jgi:hypothetical protein
MFRFVMIATLLATLVACRVSLESDDEDGLFPRCDRPVEGMGTTPACTEDESHADLAWVQQNVFRSNCISGPCHSATSTELHLVTGSSYDELVNVPSTIFPDRTLIVPGNVKASYLMFVLGAFPPEMADPPGAELPPQGYMPMRSGKLCCEKITALERWIEAGAPTD